MARTAVPLTNWTAGELSPKLDIRIDLDKYRNGARRIRNMLVMPHGGVRKRPGSRHVFEVKDSASAAPVFVKFQFNTEQAYGIEIGNLYARFYRDRGIITTGVATAQMEVVLTSGTSWVVPASFNSLDNSIVAYGSGAGGATGGVTDGGGGGGGGAQSSVVNLALTPSATIAYVIGAAGAADTNGGDTYFNGASLGASSVGAKGGTKGLLGIGGAGGLASASVGTFKANGNAGADQAGGIGGTGGDAATSPTGDYGRGGDGGDATVAGDAGLAGAIIIRWTVASVGIVKTISAVTKANPGVVTYVGADPANGDQVIVSGAIGMTQLNGRRFTVANVNAGANTFELLGVNTSAYGTYTSGGEFVAPLEVVLPYALSEVNDLRFAQTADTLYIGHEDYPIAKLTRSSHTDWVYAEAAIEGGPFRPLNGDLTDILTPVGTATTWGTIAVGTTVTLSATSFSPFVPEHVGALFRLWEPGQVAGGATVRGFVRGMALANNLMYTVNGNVYVVTNLTGLATYANEVPSTEHTEGTVKLSGTAGSFDSTYLHNSQCILQVTGYLSPTAVTCSVVGGNHIPASVLLGTAYWEEGAWSDVQGYPRVLAFQESRLWAASSPQEPGTVWASRSRSPDNFLDGAEANSAIRYPIVSNEVDALTWLMPGKVLLAGSAASEYAIASSAQNEPISPENIRIVPQQSFGSAAGVFPVKVGSTVMTGQRSGTDTNPALKLRGFEYSFEKDGFVGSDLTIVADHITGTGITALAYQASPDSIVWGRRSDGLMAALTYEEEQNVIGWHLHTMGGVAAQVKRVCVLPGPEGDELFMVVARTIGGATKQYIEYLTSGLLDSMVHADAIYLDASATYDGSAANVITGLWHLEGQTVYTLEDGAKGGPYVVSSGSITLADDYDAEVVHVGFKVASLIESVDLEAGAQAGTAKSRPKRIRKIYLDLYRSLGGTFGFTGVRQMRTIRYRRPQDFMGAPTLHEKGLIECSFPGRWSREATILLEHDDPYPFTVLGLVADLTTVG